MDIIKSNAEISRIFEKGKRIGTKDITLILLRNEKQHGQGGRAAFIAGKRLGNSVWRNRAKRRMRSVYRECISLFDGFDALFIAKRSINEANYDCLVNEVRRSMKREVL